MSYELANVLVGNCTGCQAYLHEFPSLQNFGPPVLAAIVDPHNFVLLSSMFSSYSQQMIFSLLQVSLPLLEVKHYHPSFLN